MGLERKEPDLHIDAVVKPDSEGFCIVSAVLGVEGKNGSDTTVKSEEYDIKIPITKTIEGYIKKQTGKKNTTLEVHAKVNIGNYVK